MLITLLEWNYLMMKPSEKKVFMDCKQYALISIMNLVSEICGMCFFEGITVDKHSRQLDSFLNIE